MTNVIKHGKRTARRPCRHCKETGLYWGHDLDGTNGRKWCPEHSSANWVLVDFAGVLHDCQGNGGQDTGQPDDDSAAHEPQPITRARPSRPLRHPSRLQLRLSRPAQIRRSRLFRRSWRLLRRKLTHSRYRRSSIHGWRPGPADAGRGLA